MKHVQVPFLLLETTIFFILLVLGILLIKGNTYGKRNTNVHNYVQFIYTGVQSLKLFL